MRQAFVMGSNGPDGHPGLSRIYHARSDAEKFTDHLSAPRCDFEVTTPERGADIYSVLARLNKVARMCTAQDTFVCYFAGHGLVEGPELFLLWDKSEVEGPLGTALPISQVMLAMKLCKASSKLLILDCCHAGAALGGGLRGGNNALAEEVGVKPENHMVLLASDHIERAREINELGGGFLTAYLCMALGERFADADEDGDGRLSLDELKIWLEARAAEHNRRHPGRAVPVPYLFGQQRGPFYLTVDTPAWVPHEIHWPDGNTMIVLPVRISRGMAHCMGKHPVTNEQYRRYVENHAGTRAPSGQHYLPASFQQLRLSGDSPELILEPPRYAWRGPFAPWKEAAFSKPDQPVVCVSFIEALSYADWVNCELSPPGLTMLPKAELWDLAAFGVHYVPRDRRLWLGQTEEIHQKAAAPARVDRSGKRTNGRGVSDMIGNIWEWCDGTEDAFGLQALGPTGVEPELRGGSFLDDLSRIKPYLSASVLEETHETRHSDLGFRLAAMISVDNLPRDVVDALRLRGELLDSLN